jgi:hypothetical protein
MQRLSSWDSPYFTAADLEIMRNAYYSLCMQDDLVDIQVEGRKFNLANTVVYSYRPSAPDALLRETAESISNL